MPKVVLNNFTGGITDYIDKADNTYCEKLDNFLIDENKTLVQRPAIRINNSSYPRVTSNIRVDSIIEQEERFLLKTGGSLYSLTETGFSELTVDSRSVLYNHNISDHIDYTKLNNSLYITSSIHKFDPLVVNYESEFTVTQAGLPRFINDPSISLPSGGSSKSYIYAFVRYRTYTVNGLIREDYGEPTFVSVSSASTTDIDSGNTASITGITGYTNAADEFYLTGTDADDIKTRIFRTINNGTEFYYLGDSVGLIDNGTTTATDNVPDATLINNTLLYTQGNDILFNSAPPLAKYCTTALDSVWYGNTKDHPNRLYQSKPLQGGAVPATSFIEFEDDIIGLGTTTNHPIVVTKSKIYRVDGFINSDGTGNLIKRVISDEVGGISFRSIVTTQRGLYYASTDGFYFTDGYKNIKISEQINVRYLDLIKSETAKNNMIAEYDNDDQRVYFSCQIGSDNDVIYVYDERNNSFTTLTGQTTFNPASLLYYDHKMYLGDSYGYLYVFDESFINDTVRDTSASVSDWEEEAVVYTFKHVNWDFYAFDQNKWVVKTGLKVKSGTGLHIDLKTYDNDESTAKDLSPIFVAGGLSWLSTTPSIPWLSETPELRWLVSTNYIKVRKFPRGSLRTNRKQLEITNQTDAVIQKSDDYGTATVDATAKTITLDNLSNVWDYKIVGYNIVIDSVSYPVVTRNSDTVITVTDSGGSLSDGSTAWEVQGIAKDELLRLAELSFTYTVVSDRGNYYQSTESQGNA